MQTLMMYVTDIKLKKGKWCEKKPNNPTVRTKKQILFCQILFYLVMLLLTGLGYKHLYDPSDGPMV